MQPIGTSPSVCIRSNAASCPSNYVTDLRLTNVRFVVDARLRAAFVARPSRRTVHAIIKGELVPLAVPAEPEHFEGELVLCNPFVFSGFRRARDFADVAGAEEVILTADKRIYARGLIAA